MLKNHWVVSIFIGALFFSSLKAQNDTAGNNAAPVVQSKDNSEKAKIELPEGLVIRPHAYGHFQAGQIQNGSLLNNIDQIISADPSNFKIDHVWTEDGVVWAGFEAIYRENFKVALELGAKLYFSYPQEGTTNRYTKNNRQDVFLEKAYSQFKIGDEYRPQTLLQAGYFNFKYNPDARNFGDYLFRTGTYPIYFDMGFDFPQARLLGLHLQDDVLQNIARFYGMQNENMKNLKFDLLFTSATVYPTMNWSLALLGSYDIANLHFIEIGAGIDWAHLFDVYTAHSFPIRMGGDPTEPHSNLNDAYYVDTVTHDTSYYTFKGTKVMGRISIDPKYFLKSSLLGKEDLKLYAEADIIGLKSYPDSAVLIGGYAQTDSAGNLVKRLAAPSYGTWWQKMPVMIGFNAWTNPFITYSVAPALLIAGLEKKIDYKVSYAFWPGIALLYLEELTKINTRLDILNLEVEWFGAKYYNDATGLINQGNKPLPYNVNTAVDYPSRKMPLKSETKWSVYAKKSFFNGHFALVGQVGRDHMRLQTAAYDNEIYSELLIEPDDWWWVLKTFWLF
jgi:hypothetical protein